MDIIIQPNNRCRILEEFFDFNTVAIEKIDFYNNSLDTYGRYDLTNLLERDTPTLFVLNFRIFKEIVEWDQSRNQLLKFLEKHNQLWVWDDIDSSLSLSIEESLTWLEKLASVRKNGISLFLDAPLLINDAIPKNIKTPLFPDDGTALRSCPRIHGAIVEKTNCKNEFLLTMVKKRGRIHREYLWNELNERPGLLEKGYAIYRQLSDPWIGRTTHQHDWRDGHPSMDLYSSAWMEVVPETVYRNTFNITEKTIKPIGTKTPFLMISTPGYLKYLRSRGFKTFDTLIDESYNEQPNIEDQARMLVDRLEDIVKSGAENFYNASKDILDHNHQRLAEIGGKWQYNMDRFIVHNLAEIGIHV